MKLLIENFRKYRAEHDFKLLCENFDRGIITEQELYETWERQVLLEMDNLIEEGIMDILQQGYQKGKELVGKAKEMYDAAVQKVSDFILKLSTQAFMLMEKAKVMLAKIAGVLRKAYNFINKFCGAHPILCRVVKILLIMISIAAVMALFASPAQASVDVSGMYPDESQSSLLTDSGLEAIKGMMALGTEDADPDVQQAAVDAFNWLEQAHKSEQVVDLAKEGPELVQKFYLKVDAESPEMFDLLVDIGKETTTVTRKYSETILLDNKTTIKTFSHQALKAPSF
tara:strand:- start:71 stop:922 length:852 start_codon:yes stop_codon:yes gene_type:complete